MTMRCSIDFAARRRMSVADALSSLDLAAGLPDGDCWHLVEETAVKPHVGDEGLFLFQRLAESIARRNLL